MRTIVWILMGVVFSRALAARAEDEPRTEEGFRVPTPGYAFAFPRDHGSHPEFRIEWWYITGHLRDAEERRYGFQATFFRYALKAGGVSAETAFGSDQLHMAHMALTEVDGQRFHHEERLNRGGWDAFARVGDMDLANGNWSLRRTSAENMALNASIRSDVRMAFTLEPTAPKAFFGEDGFSRKGADPAACSWYITFPRLRVEGTLELDDEKIAVTGEAWMDHEISSSQLGRDQVGWDWLSVRFDDGSAMMVYMLRDTDGRADPYSTLAWIDAEGRVTHQGPDRFEWTSEGDWTSPDTGATYPIDVRLRGERPNGEPFDFAVKPLMRAQELVGDLGGISYWEGACDLLEEGRRVGEGYMELTGYEGSLAESLR